MSSPRSLLSGRVLARSRCLRQGGAGLPRAFRSSARLMETSTIAVPVRKPMGTFRGGLFGFLLGSTVAGGLVYYYILDEYKIANQMLTEDIYALHAAVQRIHTHVQSLEEQLQTNENKRIRDS